MMVYWKGGCATLGALRATLMGNLQDDGQPLHTINIITQLLPNEKSVATAYFYHAIENLEIDARKKSRNMRKNTEREHKDSSSTPHFYLPNSEYKSMPGPQDP
jgi:hypothetical protein